jgi:tRNA A-37 threonylcarbamoyl transferase component Bud32
MATTTEIGTGPFTLSTTGASFRAELDAMLIRRSKLVLVVGFGISVVVRLLMSAIDVPRQGAYDSLFLRYYDYDYLHVAAFGLGVGLLYLARPSARAAQAIAFWVLAFNLAAVIVRQYSTNPIYPPTFGVALMLFIPAAFIPWRVGYQVWLGVVATASVAAAHLLVYSLQPGAPEFWSTQGGPAVFRGYFITDVAFTSIMAIVAVLMTRMLYGLRKTAHEAKRLGNYFIERQVGKGGMGEVFVARHALMCRPTAVKVLRAPPGEENAALVRFEREVRLSSTLTHPNTITIFDFGRTSDSTFYYAMEYLHGMDLQVLVERFGPLHAERAVHILEQICGSLAEAHRRGIVHRDLKPSNVFLTERGGIYDFVKVLDFGLAKQVSADGAAAVTKTGVVFGTPRYIAPESAYGEVDVDARADLYNVGAIAYWMLTGQPPFSGDSPVRLIIDHIKTAPTPPSELSELPIHPELEAIVLKCLEKDPADRYQSATEVVAALRSIGFDEPWSQERAEQWWSLHLASDTFVQECFCAPSAEGTESAAHERLALEVASG